MNEEKIWLLVRFEDNQKVKKLGAKWDFVHKRWYINHSDGIPNFSQWLPETMRPKSFEKRLKQAMNKFKKKKR